VAIARESLGIPLPAADARRTCRNAPGQCEKPNVVQQMMRPVASAEQRGVVDIACCRRASVFFASSRKIVERFL
jgi:hypothetical protein